MSSSSNIIKINKSSNLISLKKKPYLPNLVTSQNFNLNQDSRIMNTNLTPAKNYYYPENRSALNLIEKKIQLHNKVRQTNPSFNFLHDFTKITSYPGLYTEESSTNTNVTYLTNNSNDALTNFLITRPRLIYSRKNEQNNNIENSISLNKSNKSLFHVNEFCQTKNDFKGTKIKENLDINNLYYNNKFLKNALSTKKKLKKYKLPNLLVNNSNNNLNYILTEKNEINNNEIKKLFYERNLNSKENIMHVKHLFIVNKQNQNLYSKKLELIKDENKIKEDAIKKKENGKIKENKFLLTKKNGEICYIDDEEIENKEPFGKIKYNYNYLYNSNKRLINKLMFKHKELLYSNSGNKFRQIHEDMENNYNKIVNDNDIMNI